MLLTLRERIAAALEAGAVELGVDPAEVPDLELTRARNPEHGDYASGAGMKLARVLRRPPPQIAAELAARVDIPEAEAVADGGYVNFRLRPQWLRSLAREVAAAGPEYGRATLGGGRKVQVEFASVNPTGPLHIGHARGVILGDALSRLLEFSGHAVEREYYVNDQNTQARLFGESVYARLTGGDLPERGYRGEYVADIAAMAREALPGVESEPRETAIKRVQAYAIDRMVERLDASVRKLGVVYDEWFHESRLWADGLPQIAIQRLRERGFLIERDGAVWFRGAGEEAEGDAGPGGDEDRVVIRATGEPTYFASDLGYLLSKFEGRGFQTVIDIWGADHHGYVPRMKAACDALGFGAENLVVILNQIVTLKEGRMSKRAGRFIPLDDLVEEVGADAVRYFFLMRSPDAMWEFDVELATSRSNDNPVYYAQYAHARLANVEGYAAEQGGALPPEADLSLLGTEAELAVLREVARWPDVVAEAARLMEPHRIPYAIAELADRVHAFYQAGNREHRLRMVVEGEPELTRARIELARAARATLVSALNLVGVSAPDRM